MYTFAIPPLHFIVNVSLCKLLFSCFVENEFKFKIQFNYKLFSPQSKHGREAKQKYVNFPIVPNLCLIDYNFLKFGFYWKQLEIRVDSSFKNKIQMSLYMYSMPVVHKASFHCVIPASIQTATAISEYARYSKQYVHFAFTCPFTFKRCRCRMARQKTVQIADAVVRQALGDF